MRPCEGKGEAARLDYIGDYQNTAYLTGGEIYRWRRGMQEEEEEEE